MKFSQLIVLLALSGSLTACADEAPPVKKDSPEAFTGCIQVCGDSDELCYSTNKPASVSAFADLIASTYGVNAEEVVKHSGWKECLNTMVDADKWYLFSVGDQELDPIVVN